MKFRYRSEIFRAPDDWIDPLVRRASPDFVKIYFLAAAHNHIRKRRRLLCVAWLIASVNVLVGIGCASRPSNWQTFDAGRFSFSMPPDLQKTSEGGIDSYVCEFGSPRMKLAFDDGLYSGNPLDLNGEPPSFMSHRERIGGHDVQIASYDRDATNHVVIANFLGNGLTMSANCKTTADRETATQVFRTVRFK